MTRWVGEEGDGMRRGDDTDHRHLCDRYQADLLKGRQVDLCRKAKGMVRVIGQGAALGIEECQHQFKERRWNCTTYNRSTVFGNVLNKNSREKAYIYSIESAALMHSITKSCAKGELQICSCDLSVHDNGGRRRRSRGRRRDIKIITTLDNHSVIMTTNHEQTNHLTHLIDRLNTETAMDTNQDKQKKKNNMNNKNKMNKENLEKERDEDMEGEEEGEEGVDFMWGGCSHDVRFGDRFTKEFVEELEDRLSLESLINSWNSEAGRMAVRDNMRLLCKCHGVSGSCSSKICWRTMSPFRQVGDELKERFDGSSQVRLGKAGRLKLRPVDKRQKKPTKRDLVYSDDSPDYCQASQTDGTLGTSGRECNRTSYGLDGCQLMCCGRGYQTLIVDVEEDCNCQFHWCCRVECEKCVQTVEKYLCN